jgi:RNA polymerase sigma-70 factor (ECF subfamily)
MPADILDALGSIAREQRGDLVRLARREGLGAEDALDCVHDAFCTLLEKLPDEPDGVGPSLPGIVVNLARNRRRRHHIARHHAPIETAEPIDDHPSVETRVMHADECVRLHACIHQLCGMQRAVVLMRLLEERPGDDVAAALGLTRGYIDVLLHRAKASLAVCMREPP